MGFVGFALSGCKDDELVKNNGCGGCDGGYSCLR